MTTYRRIKSVQLTIDIIKFIGSQDQPPSSKAIAQALEQPHSTIMCHLVTLEDGGFLKKEKDSYVPGQFFAVMWASVKRSLELKIEQAQSELDLIKID